MVYVILYEYLCYEYNEIIMKTYTFFFCMYLLKAQKQAPTYLNISKCVLHIINGLFLFKIYSKHAALLQAQDPQAVDRPLYRQFRINKLLLLILGLRRDYRFLFWYYRFLCFFTNGVLRMMPNLSRQKNGTDS